MKNKTCCVCRQKSSNLKLETQFRIQNNRIEYMRGIGLICPDCIEKKNKIIYQNYRKNKVQIFEILERLWDLEVQKQSIENRSEDEFIYLSKEDILKEFSCQKDLYFAAIGNLSGVDKYIKSTK